MPAPNKRLEAILVAVVAIACMIVVAVQGPIPGLHAIAAVLMACVLPGYAVIGALPIRKEMGGLERTALNGLRFAVAAIGAVGLAARPGHPDMGRGRSFSEASRWPPRRCIAEATRDDGDAARRAPAHRAECPSTGASR